MATTALLQTYIKLYTALGDVHRARAYTIGLHRVQEFGRPVVMSNLHQLEQMFGKNSHVFAAIREFIVEKSHKELDALMAMPNIKFGMELDTVLGFGPASIRTVLEAGIKSFVELESAIANGSIKVNNAQQNGLRYRADLSKRIPRNIVEEISAGIQKAAKETLGKYLTTFTILGSYRRGKVDSGDVDILITSPKTRPSFLGDLAARLGKKIIVIGQGEQKLTFLIRSSDNIMRQVDIFYASNASYIPYLLYGTGSAEHNEYMRGLCKSKGLLLNQFGLYKKQHGKWVIVPLKNEEALYKMLSIPYVQPRDR